MTTDAPGDMIRMQNPNQAKRCLPEMAGAAIFIPERRIPSRTLLSFACGITAAPRKAEVLQAGHFAVSSRKEGDFSMYQKIKAKFKASPTIFYACSIVASWAGVGSLMNFRTIALRYGAVPAIIWAVFNSRENLTKPGQNVPPCRDGNETRKRPKKGLLQTVAFRRSQQPCFSFKRAARSV